MYRSAFFSLCDRYRYRLSRQWDDGPCLTFIMLNPSTADAEQDDPTIRRCIEFTRREGFARLDVVNLFAGRATRPADLFAMTDPAGPENSEYLSKLIDSDQTVVAAWGAHPRAQQAFELLNKTLFFPEMLCLGVSKTGAPRHPLYVPKNQAMHKWQGMPESVD